jgi:hypothetical protein
LKLHFCAFFSGDNAFSSKAAAPHHCTINSDFHKLRPALLQQLDASVATAALLILS